MVLRYQGLLGDRVIVEIQLEWRMINSTGGNVDNAGQTSDAHIPIFHTYSRPSGAVNARCL